MTFRFHFSFADVNFGWWDSDMDQPFVGRKGNPNILTYAPWIFTGDQWTNMFGPVWELMGFTLQ